MQRSQRGGTGIPPLQGFNVAPVLGGNRPPQQPTLQSMGGKANMGRGIREAGKRAMMREAKQQQTEQRVHSQMGLELDAYAKMTESQAAELRESVDRSVQILAASTGDESVRMHPDLLESKAKLASLANKYEGQRNQTMAWAARRALTALESDDPMSALGVIAEASTQGLEGRNPSIDAATITQVQIMETQRYVNKTMNRILKDSKIQADLAERAVLKAGKTRDMVRNSAFYTMGSSDIRGAVQGGARFTDALQAMINDGEDLTGIITGSTDIRTGTLELLSRIADRAGNDQMKVFAKKYQDPAEWKGLGLDSHMEGFRVALDNFVIPTIQAALVDDPTVVDLEVSGEQLGLEEGKTISVGEGVITPLRKMVKSNPAKKKALLNTLRALTNLSTHFQYSEPAILHGAAMKGFDLERRILQSKSTQEAMLERPLTSAEFEALQQAVTAEYGYDADMLSLFDDVRSNEALLKEIEITPPAAEPQRQEITGGQEEENQFSAGLLEQR